MECNLAWCSWGLLVNLTLVDLGVFDGQGHAQFRIAAERRGTLVLWHPEKPLRAGLRELEAVEKLRLAANVTRPVLVVQEASQERYVLLIDGPPDPEHYRPLSPDDAELLANVRASARFGRRDHDVLSLTPWDEADVLLTFSVEDPAFEDIPVVSLHDENHLAIHRGDLPATARPAVLRDLRSKSARPTEHFGVLGNMFGEHICVRHGQPFLQHEDVRRNAVVNVAEWLEGAPSLRNASERLRRLAHMLDLAAGAGWTMTGDAVDGLLLAQQRPTGVVQRLNAE